MGESLSRRFSDRERSRVGIVDVDDRRYRVGSLHILNGDCRYLRNLQGTFGPFGYERAWSPLAELEVAQRGPRAVRGGVQRVGFLLEVRGAMETMEGV